MADLSTQIKNTLKKEGLDEDLFDQINVTKEEEIDGAVKVLKKEIEDLKSLSPEDFLTTIEKAGLTEPMKKYVLSETDRKLGKAIKNHDANLAKEKEDGKTKIAQEKQKEGMSEDQIKMSDLAEMINKQNETIEKLVQKTSEKDITTVIQTSLKDAELDEGFAKFINVNAVDEVGDAVKNLKDMVLAGQQQKLDKKLEDMGVPVTSKGPTPSDMESMVSAYAEGKNEVEGGGGIIAEKLKNEKGE